MGSRILKSKKKSKKKNYNKLVRDLLKEGSVVFFYSPDCRYCKKQIRDLGVKNISKYPKAIECNENCMQVVPSWIGVNGNIIVGLQKPRNLYKNLISKKRRMMFGSKHSVPYSLSQQPQYLGMTDYCRFGSAPLARPYGPRDNANLKGTHYTGSKLNPQFGQTPGTPEFKQNSKASGGANSKGIAASGGVRLYEDVVPDPLYPELKINVPRQFTNNRLNNPAKFTFGGPNNVGHQPNMDLYPGAGANTTNWLSGKPYRPLKSLKKVAGNGYLGKAKTLKNASKRSYKLTHKGSKFGSKVYTKDSLNNSNTMYQPTPPYLNTKFGGKIITLDPSGKVTVSPSPKNTKN